MTVLRTFPCDTGHPDMLKCCGLGSDVCPASRTTNLRPLYISYIARITEQNLLTSSAAEQQSGNPGKWSQRHLPSLEPRIPATIFCSASLFQQHFATKKASAQPRPVRKPNCVGQILSACCLQSAKQKGDNFHKII